MPTGRRGDTILDSASTLTQHHTFPLAPCARNVCYYALGYENIGTSSESDKKETLSTSLH